MEKISFSNNVGPSEEDLRRKSIIETWDLNSIRRRVSGRMRWTENYAQLVEGEYRKFILLAGMNKGEQYGMAGPVDEFWHEHLLDTRDYFAMCRTVAGELIHHVPLDDKEPSSRAYENTRRDLVVFFGDASAIWPSDVEACRTCASCKSFVDVAGTH